MFSILGSIENHSTADLLTTGANFIRKDQQISFVSSINSNDSSSYHNAPSMCYTKTDLSRIRHRTIAYVYLQSFMSIDWSDEKLERSNCHFDTVLPSHLLATIHNLTSPRLRSRPGLDYFHEHQFCTQAYHFIGSYANCSIPLKVGNFQNWYKFLYDRRLSLKNRYTIGFVIGTFIPSCICIISSFICLFYISLRPSIRKHSHSRAELRSLSLILVEIVLSLMSALQSYVINFFTCHHLLFRMESDNCYGQSANNILPNFLGSIVELFTSTSNILILMICGSQFRHELIEILHLNRLFPSKQQRSQQKQDRRRNQQSYRSDDDERKTSEKKAPPNRMTLSLPLSSKNGTRKTNTMVCDPSLDSLLVSSQNKEELSTTEIDQTSNETNQYLIKSTTV